MEADMEAFMTKKRRRYKQILSLDERLQQMAHAARIAAARLPRGVERDSMLKKAHQAELARDINNSLTLPGPASPG
jgi:hypothetical protein